MRYRIIQDETDTIYVEAETRKDLFFWFFRKKQLEWRRCNKFGQPNVFAPSVNYSTVDQAKQAIERFHRGQVVLYSEEK